MPYVAHLLEVTALVLDAGGAEVEAIAALLHDAAEDQGGRDRLEDIRYRFGERVASIVEECSDTLEQPKPPWRQRKETYVERLATASESALRVSIADKLTNARAILRDFRVYGDELWSRFHQDADQLWYYRALSDVYALRASDPNTLELARVVAELESLVS